ncbi:MAG: M23 family metallopeptidase [Gemmatimonadales bacterium]
MLNAPSGVVRAIAHLRSPRPDRDTTGPGRPATARRLSRRAVGAARVMADALTATPRARERAAFALGHALDGSPEPRKRAAARRRLHRRHQLLRLMSDRTLPMAVALIVLVAAGLSLAPAAAPVGAAQEANSAGFPAVRLTVGGGPGGLAATEDEPGYVAPAAATAPADDGTLYKPVAVDTSIKSSAAMLSHYKVKDGDTLTGIASRFGVSMMTVWWANNFTSKDSLKTGMDLVIPPVTGLVRTVKVGDTLDSIAAENEVDVAQIIATNNLDDPNLIVGQVLVLPGAKGAPMPTAAPTAKPAPKPATSGVSGGPAPVYTGGAWSWPVVGGGNYISQYFHYGHLGVDIAAQYGSSIVSPLAGRVVFAGWKSNGGGYQVWIQHGSGLYSAHHHMSAVLVATGQEVAKGQRIGRIGMTGWATGTHDHFEVWVGFPWNSGSYRVNPLRYY